MATTPIVINQFYIYDVLVTRYHRLPTDFCSFEQEQPPVRVANPEYTLILNGIRAQDIQGRDAQLEYAVNYITKGAEEATIAATNAKNAAAKNRLEGTASEPLGGPTPSVDRLNQIDPDGDSISATASNPYYSIRIKQPFIDNVKNLAGGLAADGIALSRREKDILITPKPDLVAKLFILPEWTNEIRSRLESESYSDQVYATTDFALTQVQEQEAEKYQIIETFGDDIVYFHGKRPTVYSFSGNLLNTVDNQWKNNFYTKYKEIMRGTKCAENKTRAYLFYDDILVEGYMLNLSMSMNAQETKVVPFSFSMFITNQTRVHTNLLDNTTPATPTYQYERKMMQDVLDAYEPTRRYLDVYRTDEDRAFLEARRKAREDAT